VGEHWRFGRNLAILVSGEVLSRALGFLAFTQLARLLDPPGYGRVELTQAVMVFLTLTVDLGLGTLGTREIAARSAPVRKLICGVVSAQLLLAIAVYGLLVLAVVCLPVERVLARLLLGFALGLFGFPFLLPWVFQGWNRMGPVAALQVLRYAVFVVVALSVVRGPTDLLRLPWAEVSAVTVTAIGHVALLRRAGERVTINIRAGCNPHLLWDGLPIGGSQLVWACRMYLPIMLLAASSGQAVIAFFGAAHRIVMVGGTLLALYFTALFPTMSAASTESPEALAVLLRRSMRRLLWPTLAVTAATTLAAAPVMRLVFGGQFVRPEASGSLAVLMWILPLLVWRRHYRNGLIVLNRQREELACSLFGLVILVGLTAYLGSRYGAVGGAWAMVLSEGAGALATWWRLKHWLSAQRRSDAGLGGTYVRNGQ
jgi:O-antigen/teichoic acid export membrane protein